VVADEAVEGNDGAVSRTADVLDDSGYVDGIAREAIDILLESVGHFCVLAAAYWWKKGDFVAGLQRGVPGNEFLIARGDYGRAIICEVGMGRAERGEKRFDWRAVGELDGVFRLADDFFEATKEEDADGGGL